VCASLESTGEEDDEIEPKVKVVLGNKSVTIDQVKNKKEEQFKEEMLVVDVDASVYPLPPFEVLFPVPCSLFPIGCARLHPDWLFFFFISDWFFFFFFSDWFFFFFFSLVFCLRFVLRFVSLTKTGRWGLPSSLASASYPCCLH
jgi:hypothetical protein